MNNVARRFTLLFSLLALVPTLLFATGTIKGIVKDAQTGEGLPGANVVIKSIYLGTSTYISGEYVLTGVPDGSQVLTISFLGYEEQNITVEIIDGESKIIDISLQPMSIQGDEVTVTAQVLGQRAAINQQLAASTVMNVVSGKKIQELPDANAAESIGRLPGISLKRSGGEANQVVVRGLSPKYNNVMIEGIKVSSTNDFDRSVDLSLVQSESLSGIEVSKSLRADMDADALGGTINLRLQPAFAGLKVGGAAELGYADINQNYRNYKFEGHVSNRFFDNKIGVSLKGSIERKELPSHQFSGSYGSVELDQVLDDDGNIVSSSYYRLTNSATLTDIETTRHRGNGTFILDYKNDWWEAKFFNLLTIKNNDVITRDNEYNFNTSISATQYEQTNYVSDSKTLSRTHTFQNTFRFGTSKLNVDLSTTYAEVEVGYETFPFLDATTGNSISVNTLKNAQPRYLMDLFGGPEALDISNSYLLSLELEDRLLTDKSYDTRLDYEWSFKTGGMVTGKIKTGGKYHELSRDSEAQSEYSSFRYGGNSANRGKLVSMFPDIELGGDESYGVAASNFVDAGYNPGEFLNGRYELGWGADVEYLQEIQHDYYNGTEEIPQGGSYYVSGTNSYQRDYEASEKLYAAYLMAEVNIGSKLMLLPGIRFEDMNTEYSAYHIITNSGATGIDSYIEYRTLERHNAHWFPSLNMKYKPNDWLNIQGAVYASTTRPSFRRISPYVEYSSTSDVFSSNNPFLKPARAWNYDVGMSISQSEIGLFTVYGFFKTIDDLIFTMPNYQPAKISLIEGGPDDLLERLVPLEYYNQAQITTASNTYLPINNPERAYIGGIELSWQTNFWYLPGALKGLVLDINLTLLDTKTKYPYFNDVVVSVDSSSFIPKATYGLEYETTEARVIDQPKSILNVILGWDYKGFSARVSYRFQSKTSNSVDARYAVSNTFYDDFTLVDVMLKQKINNKLSVYANLTNIGNHVDDYYYLQDGTSNKLPTKAEYYGARAQMGVKFNF